MVDEKVIGSRHRIIVFITWFFVSVVVLLLLQTTSLYDLGAILFFFSLVALLIVNSKLPLGLSYFISASVLARVLYAYHLFSNNIIMFPDTVGYFRIIYAMLGAHSLSFKNVVNYAGTLHIGYHYVAFITLKIFRTEFSLYLLNIFLFVLSLLLLRSYFDAEFGTNIATAITIFLNFSAFTFIFTSDVLKDSLVLFLSTFSIYVYGKYKRTGRPRYAILFVVSIAYLTASRIYSGVGLAVGIVIDFLISHEIRISFKQLVLATASIVLMFLITPLRTHIDLGMAFISKVNLSPTTVVSLLKATVSFFFSPLFWNMTSEFTVYTPLLLDSMFLLVFSPLLFRFFLKFFQEKEFRRLTYIYLVPILFHIVALGLEYETGGDRQKIAVYPFIILLYLLGL